MDSYEALDLASGCNTVKNRYLSCYTGDFMTTYRIMATDFNDDVGRVVAESYKRIIDGWYDAVGEVCGILQEGAEEIARAYSRLKEITAEFQRALNGAEFR